MNFLVTGGSSGLGKAIVEQLSTSASNLITYTYYKTPPTNLLPNVSAIHVDFSEHDSYTDFINELNKKEFDVLINNYHVGYTQKHVNKINESDLINSFQNNVAHTINITNQLISHFKAQKKGTIVTILSDYVSAAPPTGLSTYVAEKLYLRAFTQAWHSELSAKNIYSIAVSPKFMNTPFNADLPSFIIEDLENKGQTVKPETVAKLIENVCTEPAKWSGQNIFI